MKIFNLFILVILFQSCQSQEKNPEKNNNNLNQITLEVSKPINDFKIKILWIPSYNLEDIKLIGPAIIELKNIKSGEKFLTTFSNFHIWKDFQDINFKDNGQVKEMLDNYYIIEPSEIENLIAFKDVDFDNKFELILQESDTYDASSSFSNIVFYDFEENQLSRINKEPFTNITNLKNTEFNADTKEIIMKEFYSCCEWESTYFKILNKNNTTNNFELYKTEYHKVDPSTNIDTIKINENGTKERVIIEVVKTN